MRVDLPKPLGMVAMLALLYAACTPTQPDKQPVERLPAVATATALGSSTSEICYASDAELLRPPRLRRDSVVTYPGGIIVSYAGEAMKLQVASPLLIIINHEGSLGLNFTPESTNVTYFFAGSFNRKDAGEYISGLMEADKEYLTQRYCQDRGQAPDQFRFSAISVADELRKVINKQNPRGSFPTDLSLRRELSTQFAFSYVGRARVASKDPRQIPLEVAELSAQDRISIIDSGLPFLVTSFNPDYLGTLDPVSP